MIYLLERLTPFRGDVADVHDCLGIVDVDVEDGTTDDTADVRAVR